MLCSIINLHMFILFTLGRNSQRSLAVTSRPLTLSCQRRLYLHPIFYRGSIFLPPLACGFTLPQGDSRWRFPIFSFKNLGLSLLNTHCFQHLGLPFSEGHYLFSSDTKQLLFHLMPSLRCFRFRTI